jgi:uncharacterized repeat protein (TIGR03833 family)
VHEVVDAAGLELDAAVEDGKALEEAPSDQHVSARPMGLDGGVRQPSRSLARRSPGGIPLAAGIRHATMDGTDRANIRPGSRVSIVLKADQASGRLTEGIVADILTRSPTHPHGIKVRLVTGEVGRVKVVD